MSKPPIKQKKTPTVKPSTKTDFDLSSLSPSQLESLLTTLSSLDESIKYNAIDYLFSDTGPYARSLYLKSMEFFKATKDYKTVVQLGGNRSGKSYDSNYLMTMTATGLYPKWWDGWKAPNPKEIWSTGDSHSSVRDISQTILLGPINDLGTGMIPKHLLVDEKGNFRVRMKQGIPNAIDHCLVRHKNGHLVKIAFKSYEQGRKSFQGTSIDLIVFDEEPKDQDIFSEGLARTITTGGKCVFTFTPLEGLTPLVLNFLPNGEFPIGNVLPGQSVYVMQKTWEDVPHIPEEERKTMMASWRPWELEARTKGLPMVGAGKVFITPESDIKCEPFELSLKWPRGYGLDIAFFSGVTCAVFFAIDPTTGIVYIYDVYKCTGQLPEVPAAAIRRRGGTWIPGVIDPSAKRYGSKGMSFVHEYSQLGLDIVTANNSIEPGILRFTNMLAEGMLRVFSTCSLWFEEYRIYRYSKDSYGCPSIAKNQNDHAMDATRYFLMSGLDRAISFVEYEENQDHYQNDRMRQELRNQDRDPHTGY